MGYRTIRRFGVFSMVIAVLIVAGGFWQIFAPGSRSAEYGPVLNGNVSLAFLLIGLVAGRVSATLEAQAREIDWLKTRMDQVQLGRDTV